jgi:hypothetical protein
MRLGLHLVAPGILASGCASGGATALTPNQAQQEPTKLPQGISPALLVEPQRILGPAWVPPDADATQVFLEVGAIGTGEPLRWRISGPRLVEIQRSRWMCAYQNPVAASAVPSGAKELVHIVECAFPGGARVSFGPTCPVQRAELIKRIGEQGGTRLADQVVLDDLGAQGKNRFRVTLACEPGQAQWRTVTSSEGGFSIDFPDAPTFRQKPHQSPTGATVSINEYSFESSEAEYFVSFNDLPAGHSVDSAFNGGLTRMLSATAGTLEKVQRGEQFGYPAMDILITVNQAVLCKVRIIDTGRKVFAIAGSAPRGNQANVNRFISSFRFGTP